MIRIRILNSSGQTGPWCPQKPTNAACILRACSSLRAESAYLISFGAQCRTGGRHLSTRNLCPPYAHITQKNLKPQQSFCTFHSIGAEKRAREKKKRKNQEQQQKKAMGNAQASPSDPRFAMATRAFAKQELDDLKSLFDSLAAQSQSNGKVVSLSAFQTYFGINGPLAIRMFDLVTQSRKDGMLAYEDLVIAKGVYEKGTSNEIDEFVYQLCDINGDGIVGRSDLVAVLGSIYDTIFSQDGAQPCLSSHQDSMEVFLSAATLSKEVEGTESSMSLADFKNWCRVLPSVRKFLGSLLMPPDSGGPGFQVPCMHHPEKLSHDLLILSKEYAWHIGGALAQQELEAWKLLYHSAINGLSFNTFMSNISSGDGPTVFVIKDAEGYIYGGYASQPWERQSDFYGDMKSFVFQLYPQASIFRPTGANNNLQWCAINFSSDSIPNGIGFGGRANHFGLFLSANFDQGHTFECTTFNSPCLSRTNRIRPEVIECWGIQVKGMENEKLDSVKGTVLERFKEDRNMLKLVGLANSSE